MNTPGIYTAEALESYRNLDSYALFHAGNVHTVYCHKVSEQCPVSILKAKVARSQTVSDKPYEAWATVFKKTGQINAAHCTCMAG